VYHGFQLKQTGKSRLLSLIRLMDKNPKQEKQIKIEIVARKEVAVKKKETAKKRVGVYKEVKESVIEKAIDSPLSTVLAIIFNPAILVLAIYFSSVGWNKVLWLQVSYYHYLIIETIIH
jgi:hypothetical protein